MTDFKKELKRLDLINKIECVLIGVLSFGIGCIVLYNVFL